MSILSEGLTLLVPCAASAAPTTPVDYSGYASPSFPSSPSFLYPPNGSGGDGSSPRPTGRAGSLLQLKIGRVQCRGGDFLELERREGREGEEDDEKGGKGGTGSRGGGGTFITAREREKKREAKEGRRVSIKGDNADKGEEEGRGVGGAEWGYDPDRPSQRPARVVHIR